MDEQMNELGATAPPADVGQGQGQGQDASQAEDAVDDSAESLAPANASAKYAKLLQAADTLETVKAGLDSLLSLGDTVTPEDVVKVAGGLVGHGLSPSGIATMLVDMPQKGDMLSQWVQQQDQQVVQRTAQLEFVTNTLRHQMGVSAMQGLMEHHLANTGAPPEDPAVMEAQNAGN